MNDRQDPYAQGRQVVGYDAYGQPVYQQVPQQAYDPYEQQAQQQQAQQQAQAQQQMPYDPYAQQPYQQQTQQQVQQTQQQQQGQGQGQGYGYDPYGAPQQPQIPQQQQQSQYTQQAQQPPPSQQQPQPPYAYDPYADGTGQQPRVVEQPEPEPERAQAAKPGPGGSDSDSDGEAADYRTEQFSFIEEPDDDSEDVIDWLKFAETRTERRGERKRRGRNRVTLLVLVLVIALVGGGGYLWYAGKLPGLPGSGAGAAEAGGAQKRDVVVVHLREVKSGSSSTALLVDNRTTKKATTVLLPNTLALSPESGGSTTLGRSVAEDGAGPTRDSVNTLLGADIKSTWRLDTPYLENLVESVGGIAIDTDTAVPGAKKGDKPLVAKGSAQDLTGQAAVGYATYRAPGEGQAKQLLRFGQVMRAVLKKVSSERDAATATVRSLQQIPDPSLSEAQLGGFLARLAGLAKSGSYGTALLPVERNGTLSERAAQSVVKDVLGGTVKENDPKATPRVNVKNASGAKGSAGSAQVTLVNGGYTYIDGGAAGAARTVSQVTYSDDAQRGKAEEVAKTLGLSDGVVKKGKSAPNADVTVILGSDYSG
ncbi:LCP family protein [Streptomyces sp. H27-D2]|uniref:LCP family protein n=1 Tax=Streptomyces sp. H27-D2 TaxID=3046304 RepID=UPI002DB6EB9C|nr:LCP family protein [Streptomyces sp. H27-D2]MEC4014821.1 LCP family protein [Streptomyces sp. H27-D2]